MTNFSFKSNKYDKGSFSNSVYYQNKSSDEYIELFLTDLKAKWITLISFVNFYCSAPIWNFKREKMKYDSICGFIWRAFKLLKLEQPFETRLKAGVRTFNTEPALYTQQNVCCRTRCFYLSLHTYAKIIALQVWEIWWLDPESGTIFCCIDFRWVFTRIDLYFYNILEIWCLE